MFSTEIFNVRSDDEKPPRIFKSRIAWTLRYFPNILKSYDYSKRIVVGVDCCHQFSRFHYTQTSLLTTAEIFTIVLLIIRQHVSSPFLSASHHRVQLLTKLKLYSIFATKLLKACFGLDSFVRKNQVRCRKLDKNFYFSNLIAILLSILH